MIPWSPKPAACLNSNGAGTRGQIVLGVTVPPTVPAISLRRHLLSVSASFIQITGERDCGHCTRSHSIDAVIEINRSSPHSSYSPHLDS
jgi:hypothetical protein